MSFGKGCNMIFLDKDHENFYKEQMTVLELCGDIERESLVYLLGLTDTTRKHFEEIYNIKSNCIKPTKKLFDEEWQTSTSLAIIRLAYNLYGGFTGKEDDEAYKYSVLSIFSSCRTLIPYLYEAIKIRFEI